MQLAVFDLLINNADRKGGHCLLGIDGKIWAIDNGLTFHLEHKLRTVICDFAGEQIPDNLVSDMRNLHFQLIEDTEKVKISSYLLPMEITSLIERLDAYIEKPDEQKYDIAFVDPNVLLLKDESTRSYNMLYNFIVCYSML